MTTNYEPYAEFHAAARAIVAALDEGSQDHKWTYRQTTDMACRAERDDGLALCLWFSSGSGKIEVSPAVPMLNGSMRSLRDWGVIGYNDSPPRATVSMARPAAVLARDITRRVVEPYAPLYATIKARHAETMAQQDQAASVARQLADCLNDHGPLDPKRHSPGGSYNFMAMDKGAINHARIVVQPYARVDIDLRSMSPDDALAVIAFLRARKPGGAS